MKKRIFVILLLMFVCFFACSVVTFAADDSGGGFFPSFGDILDFIKNIFIPKPNYFVNKFADLNGKVNDKLGGIAYLYSTLNNFFKALSGGAPDIGLAFTIPANYLFSGHKGISVDALTSARPYLKFMKDVLNVSCCLFTATCCYHKLRVIFEVGAGE